MKTKRTAIAAVAHNCSTGDSDKNLALMEEVLAGGETSETDIYVFPELNISGGVIKTDLIGLGETVPDGSHVEEVCALAKRYQTAICAGLVETSTDGMFLTHFIERARSSKVLALDAGDCVSGTPVSILFQGRPIFEAMTAVGYDAVTLGNHEFDYGWREILAYRDIADFPLLSANARGPAGELIADAPFATLSLEDLRVGIVGVTTQKTRDITTTKGNEGVTFDGEIASVRAAIDSIRAYVDIVILLSHAGHVADSTLAESVDGIDLIVSGHNHTVVSPPQIVKDTPIVRAGAYTSHVGHVQLLYDHDAGQVTKVEGFVVPAADDQLQQPDPKIAAIVAKWEDRVSQLVDVTIGHTERDWSKEEMYMLVEHILATQSSSDLGFYNKGGVRNRLYQGNITARHIWNIHPFGNQLAIVQIRGRDIGGELLQRLTAAGTALDPDQLYTVATNSFVVEPPRRESLIGTAKSVWLEEDLIRDVVINYIKEGGPIDALLTPTTTEE